MVLDPLSVSRDSASLMSLFKLVNGFLDLAKASWLAESTGAEGSVRSQNEALHSGS